MQTRQILEQLERETLAPYAALGAESRGRRYPVNPCNLRTDYQRDRDRIIHSAAFRKLEYKTQVYVIHEGDYYRTRLTHTIEVAQIARTLARCLRLNQDLAEAIALAHDLGHTPFGHSGESVLNRLLQGHGGFEHNLQGLRVVEFLEERYGDFPGLNLTYETLEGIAKHGVTYGAEGGYESAAGGTAPRGKTDGGKTSPAETAPAPRQDSGHAPLLEAQLVDLADEIAYNQHDLDDALKMGLITRANFAEIPWLEEVCAQIVETGDKHRETLTSSLRCRLIGVLIDRSVRDVLETTTANIERAAPRSLKDVREHGRAMVTFSPAIAENNREMRRFLMKNVYRHPHVTRMVSKGERFIERLFLLYQSNPRELPLRYQARIEKQGLERVIADYISGMTDHYCLEEYKRAFLP